MEVLFLDTQTDPTKAILKLYDWRYAAQLRKDNKIDEWTNEHERTYIGFVHSGQAKDFLDKIRNDEDFEEPEEGWNMAENETYLYDICTDMFTAETAVYKKLHAYQGEQIPYLVAPVALSIESGNGRSSDHHDDTWIGTLGSDIIPPDVNEINIQAPETGLLKVKGILIELIEGFTLSSLHQYVSEKSSWQSIIDQAIQNVRLFSDNDILNKDVRASNILVSPKPSGGYRVCTIDFGQCRIREKEESDLEWGRAKWSEDEEGAVGQVMKKRLAEHGFELKYQRSMRYWEWAEKE